MNFSRSRNVAPREIERERERAREEEEGREGERDRWTVKEKRPRLSFAR
jgi:hypothetical protein